MRIREQQTITITSGQTTSSAVEISRFIQGSVLVPGTMTGTTLAFHVANGVSDTFKAVETEGNEANPVTFATGRAYRIPLAAFNYSYLKLVSNGTEGANRDFTAVFFTP